MPKSRVRRRTVYTAPAPTAGPVRRKASPPWVGPAILALALIGLVWLVVYYLTNGDMPGLSALGNWNLLIGFGFLVVSLALATQWR